MVVRVANTLAHSKFPAPGDTLCDVDADTLVDTLADE